MRTIYHDKNFARRLALKEILSATQKWSISDHYYFFRFFLSAYGALVSFAAVFRDVTQRSPERNVARM